MIIFAMSIALTAQALAIPDTLPMYCLASNGDYQPIRQTDLGRLKAALKRQFRFTATLTSTGARSGVLRFRGGVRGQETITYDVAPYDDGIALLAMRTRLRGVTANAAGDDMCWRTFSFVYAQ